MPLLGYSKWERFANAINNAKTSCIKSGYDINDHFPEVGKMVQIGSKTSRKLVEYKLQNITTLSTSVFVNTVFLDVLNFIDICPTPYIMSAKLTVLYSFAVAINILLES